MKFKKLNTGRTEEFLFEFGINDSVYFIVIRDEWKSLCTLCEFRTLGALKSVTIIFSFYYESQEKNEV